MRDIAFVIDSTGSMAPRWWSLLDLLGSIVVEPGDRIMTVQYWDHEQAGHSGPVTQVAMDLSRLHPPRDGGDGPEAVFDGLLAAGNLPWQTEAQRIVILIGDIGPHWYYMPQATTSPRCIHCGITLGGIAELFIYQQIQFFAHILGPLAVGPTVPPIGGGVDDVKAFTEISEACGGKYVQDLYEIPIFDPSAVDKFKVSLPDFHFKEWSGPPRGTGKDALSNP